MLTLQEPQRIHPRGNSRDSVISRSSGADSPPYSSLLCGPKDGGSTASSPRAPSSPSSYTAANGRKDPSNIHPCSPGLSGQQKLQGSPHHNPRPSLTFSTHLASHASPKSRFSDIKYRKTSQPLCSRQSPYSRSRADKFGKESEEHKKPECKQKEKLVKKERKGEAQKTNRKGEERKRRKKKEEKRLGERKKKRDRTAKKERKFGLKTQITEKEMFTSIATSSCLGEVIITQTTQNQGQSTSSPIRHKHRERSERAERSSHRPSTNIQNTPENHSAPGRVPHPGCTSPQPSSKSENRKTFKKIVSPSKLRVKEQLIQSHPRNTSSKKTSKKPSIVSSQSSNGPNVKPDDTLPSLLFKALAPLSTACSISVEQPMHSKESGYGGILNAPDLQPVAVMGNLSEIGDNLANTPPVLSWQGSPVSVLGEDEDELEKGVMHRPVLQPSPTQCFSPPPVDSESLDDLNKEPCESTLDDYSHDNTSELCDLQANDIVEKEKEEDSGGETSGSILHELGHHKTGLDDVFKSLSTFLGGQRVPCRGGPFGGPPASTASGVKFSSSLELGPDIQCQENQDFSPTSDLSAFPKFSNQSPTHTTSDTLFKSHSSTDLCAPVTDALVQKKQEDSKNDVEEKPHIKHEDILPERPESSLLDESLSAELRLTTTHETSFTGLLAASANEEMANSEETVHIITDRKRKQKNRDGEKEEEIKIKIKKEESSIACLKNKANEIRESEERDACKTPVSSSMPVISRNTPKPLIDSTKGHILQKNQTLLDKDAPSEKADTGNSEIKIVTEEKEETSELENTISSSAGNTETKTSSSASTINTSKLCNSTPASKPCSVDPLKLKALSMGLSKELKILLIKVESAGRQTFNISEVEEQRIPLSKISINNTAADVIRACK